MEQSSFKKALGALIYELRREHKLSQERLALEADIDRTRAGQIERGEANPTIDTLARIAQVLGLTLGSLITEAEARVYTETYAYNMPSRSNDHIMYGVNRYFGGISDHIKQRCKIFNRVGLHGFLSHTSIDWIQESQAFLTPQCSPMIGLRAYAWKYNYPNASIINTVRNLLYDTFIRSRSYSSSDKYP